MSRSTARKEDAPDWAKAWLASANDPLLFATGVMGFLPPGSAPDGDRPILEKWQYEFLRDFYLDPAGKPTASPRHSIRSGHGVGKTTTISILALWFVSTHYDSKCVITAASQDQLRDGAWSELRKWWSQLPDGLKSQISVAEERAVIKAAPEMGFVVRRTASKANPEALQGIHAKHVLYLCDECSGIDDIVFEVAAGSLSTEGAIACLFSNPTRGSGFFFNTHHSMRARWRTMRVSSADVPRARGHIDDIVATYGIDSNRYRVRVLGEFPTKDDDTVIPLDLVEASVGRSVVALEYWPVWGVDVARFGDDRSCLAKRAANMLLEPPIEWSGLDSTQVAGRIKAEWDKTRHSMRPREILVDVIGYGAGVLDQLVNICKLPARGINVAESSSASHEFHRLRDELWFRGRKWFEQRDCTLPAGCEGLISELTAPTYDFTVNGRKIVESKADMKKNGLRSPDVADAFLLTFAGIPQRRESERNYSDIEGGSGWTG